MAMLDMPLQQLEVYRGTNPRPEDFDEYWETALQEMRQVDSRVEKVPSDFRTPFAECYDLFYTGVKGARIHAKFILPKERKGKIPALLMFHGYTDGAGEWSDKLQYVAAGFAVAAMECRGQGGISEDVGGVKGTTMWGHIIRGLDGDKQDMLMRNVFLDAAQLARIIMEMPEIDERKVCVTGGSQGGGLSLACAALEPGICRIGINYPFLSDYKRVWDMDLTVNAYAEIRNYFRQFDPLHQREKEIFTKLGYLDVHHLADRIRGKVMMAISIMDDICPPSTQFAVYNNLVCEKEKVIYHDYGHEFLMGYPDRLYQFFLEVLL